MESVSEFKRPSNTIKITTVNTRIFICYWKFSVINDSGRLGSWELSMIFFPKISHRSPLDTININVNWSKWGIGVKTTCFGRKTRYIVHNTNYVCMGFWKRGFFGLTISFTTIGCHLINLVIALTYILIEQCTYLLLVWAMYL